MGLRISKKLAIIITAFLLPIVCFLDYVSGYEISFSIFYLIPVAVATLYIGLTGGIIVSLLSAFGWFLNDSVLAYHPYLNPAAPYWNSMVRLGFFLTFTIIISKLNRSVFELGTRNEELSVAYEELDKLRKDQLLIKDRILSNVSHELKTPLTAIHQFVTILLDGLAGEIRSDQKEYLQIILRNINHLNRMMNDLLDSTRIDAGKLQMNFSPLSLKELVREVFAASTPLYFEKGLILEVEMADDLPAINADPFRLRQVLNNLLDNALKFTPRGGKVVISGSVYSEDPSRLLITVMDTGQGISPEAQKNLFQRLYQIEIDSGGGRKGLGLGLYISKEIVTRHKGNMWVESEIGKGSRFNFTIPFFNA